VTCGSRARRGIAEAAAKTKTPARENATVEANRVSRTEDVVSDDELARRIRLDDDDAWYILVRRYNSPVFGLCWRSTGRTAVAEELVQEVWFRLWETRETIRDGGFVARIYQIARNLCIDEARKAQHRPEDAAEPGDATATEDASDAYINVPDKVNLKIFVEELLAIVPEKERRVLLKLFAEGMTLTEVGVSEGYTPQGIRAICQRATARIRTHLSRGNAV
jgi:RNA polymerase sigma factor (sigma-70 family)